MTIAKTPAEVEADVLAAYTAITGTTLYAADPRRLLLQAVIAKLSHLYTLLELADQRNLPATADTTHLDALGAFVGVARDPGAGSVCTVQYTRTVSLAPLVIPAGHRVTTSDGAYYWATTEALTLDVGVLSGTVAVECTVTGPESNDLAPGAISVLVDPIADVTAANTTTTAGGADEQTDDEYRTQVVAAPDGFTIAGPRTAYEWHAIQSSVLILDASALGPDDTDTRAPSAGEVAVYLLIDSTDPVVLAVVVAAVQNALSEDTVRPITDLVQAFEAVEVTYTVEVSYWVHQSRAAEVAAIRDAVDAAQEAYCDWQEAALGRDVDPTELIGRMYAAGAGRVTVTEPAYQAIQASERAMRDGYVVAANYMGLYE